MPITIAVMNFKGGVGKTTLTANLAAEFAMWDNTVLMIDASAQASLTFSFLQEIYQIENSIQKLFQSGNEMALSGNFSLFAPSYVNKLIKKQLFNQGRFLEPNQKRLVLLLGWFGLTTEDLDRRDSDTYRILSKAIDVKKKFSFSDSSVQEADIVLIDCPSDFDILTKNALVAADYILIPTKLDELSVLGVEHTLKCISNFTSEYNNFRASGDPAVIPKILGVVAMMVQKRDNALISAQQIYMSRLKTANPDNIFYQHYIFSNMCRLNNSVFAGWHGAPAVCFDHSSESQNLAVRDLQTIAREAAGQIIKQTIGLDCECNFSSKQVIRRPEPERHSW